MYCNLPTWDITSFLPAQILVVSHGITLLGGPDGVMTVFDGHTIFQSFDGMLRIVLKINLLVRC